MILQLTKLTRSTNSNLNAVELNAHRTQNKEVIASAYLDGVNTCQCTTLLNTFSLTLRTFCTKNPNIQHTKNDQTIIFNAKLKNSVKS